MTRFRLLSVLACAAIVVAVVGVSLPAPGHDSAQPGPYFPHQDIVVDLEFYDATHGWVLRNDGNVYAFGVGTPEPAPAVGPSFGFDIARALEIWYFGGGGASGYVLSGFGTLHRWATPGAPIPPNVDYGPFFANHDIARDFELTYDSNQGNGVNGYVLDGFGGMHPFASTFSLLPQFLDSGPYFPNHDIARDLEVNYVGDGGENSGWILDGFGGIHPWSTPNYGDPAVGTGGPYWPGWDIARDLEPEYEGTTFHGWVLNGWGGVHPVGDAPPLPDGPYWPNWDIARDLEVDQGSNDGCEDFEDALVLDGWGARHVAHADAGTDPCEPTHTGSTNNV